MCPLRIILIFLSATLAGIFLLRNLNSHSDSSVTDAASTSGDVDSTSSPSSDSKSVEKSPSSDSKSVEKSPSKINSAFVNGFWTCVDMASGRYLWRNLVAASKQSD